MLRSNCWMSQQHCCVRCNALNFAVVHLEGETTHVCSRFADFLPAFDCTQPRIPARSLNFWHRLWLVGLSTSWQWGCRGLISMTLYPRPWCGSPQGGVLARVGLSQWFAGCQPPAASWGGLWSSLGWFHQMVWWLILATEDKNAAYHSSHFKRL